MAIEFCPLADEVGNLADWVSVGIGAVAAIATTVVAILAYLTSNRATDIADEAKRIAQQQHDQTVALRDTTGRILGSLLQVEIATLPMRLGSILRDFDAAVTPIKRREVVKDTKLNAVMSDLGVVLLPAAERVFDQIHNLPGDLGAELASMMGMTRNIGVTAKIVEGRFSRASDMEGGFLIVGYTGELKNLDSLRTQIAAMLRFSLNLATSFNGFVKGEVIDYSREIALLDG